MACLQLCSTNPKLSYILSKNPASGLFARNIREGSIFGWFGAEGTYNVYFKDSDGKVSYKTHPLEDFEYNNKTRYNSSLFVLNAFTNVMRSAFIKQQEDDIDGFTNSIELNTIYLSNMNCLKGVSSPHVTVEVSEINKVYTIKFTTQKSINFLLNFVACFALLNAVYRDDEYINVNEDFLKKYLRSMEVVDLPYFARYIFKTKLMRSTTWFKAYQQILEKSDSQKLEMKYGFLSDNRYYAVKDYLKDKKDSIFDFGCGVGRYIDPLTKGRAIKYYALDKDENCIEKVKNRCKYENLDTFTDLITLLNVYKDVDGSPPLSVIIIEVLEHLDYEDAAKIVEVLLAKMNVNHMLITTPNVEFNKYYSEDPSLRIEDHKFELAPQGFKELINKQIPNGYKVTFSGIGDSVNGEQPSQMAIIERAI